MVGVQKINRDQTLTQNYDTVSKIRPWTGDWRGDAPFWAGARMHWPGPETVRPFSSRS